MIHPHGPPRRLQDHDEQEDPQGEVEVRGAARLIVDVHRLEVDVDVADQNAADDEQESPAVELLLPGTLLKG